MTEASSVITPAKLPLIDTIRRSYRDYFGHFRDVIFITWPWVLASSVTMGLAVWMQFAWMARAVADLKASVPVGPTPGPVPQMPAVPPETLVLGILANLILVFAIPSIAVAWHRRLLLDEAPGFAVRNVMSGDYWRYVGGCLMLGVLVGLPLLLVTVPLTYFTASLWSNTGPGKLPSELIWPPVMMAVAGIIALAALMHLVLVLPARAIGDQKLGLHDVWVATRGNAWRLFGGLCASVGPPVLLGQAAALAIAGHPGADLLKMSAGEIMGLGSQLAIASATSVGFYLLVLPLGFGFLSHAYRYFFPVPASN